MAQIFNVCGVALIYCIEYSPSNCVCQRHGFASLDVGRNYDRIELVGYLLCNSQIRVVCRRSAGVSPEKETMVWAKVRHRTVFFSGGIFFAMRHSL